VRAIASIASALPVNGARSNGALAAGGGDE
jgi:hypothetical protein